MKISQKLILGFLVVASLVGFVAYIGVNASKRVGETFQVVKEGEIPALVATLEMKATARQVSIKAIEYSLRGEEKDKKKTIEALGKLDAHLVAFKKAENREDIKEKREHVATLQRFSDTITFYKIRVNEYIALKDKGASIEELFSKEEELHKVRRELISILYQKANYEKEALSQTLARTKKYIANGARTILILGLANIFLSILIGLFITRSICNPIKILRNLADEISKGNFDIKVDIKSSDEIGQLTNSFNIMAEDLRIHHSYLDRLIEGRTAELRNANEKLQQEINDRKRMEEQLRQAQKLESVGRLAGGVAHDFNNLLTTIIGYSELISTEQNLDDTTKEGIQEIRSSAERAAALTQQLLAFSRKQVLQPQIIDLNSLITKLGKMLRRLIGEDIDLITELDSSLGHNIKADPGQLEQVIMNLVVNARDSMPEGGTITIETQGLYLDESYHQQHPQVTPGNYLLLAVSDTGHGMDEETRNHIFEPFYTTKGVGEGTGLGLSTVYGIVKQSGGFIWVYSEPEQGTTFKIYLPRLAATKKQQENLPDKLDPMGGTETILLVEDEESLRKLALKILKRLGYSVVEATDGMDALEIVNKEDHPEIDLLVTDVIMPKMGGKELSEKLFEEYPKLKVLFICGYTDNAIAHHGVLDEGVSLLQNATSR
ncbi:Sensor histidine kinase RcsC [subsurface metagenome]